MTETIVRAAAIHLIARARLAFGDEAQSAALLEDHGLDPPVTVAALQTVLSESYGAVSNGHLSEIYEAITGRRVEVIGEHEELLACPCCSYRTLTERYNVEEGTGYDICAYCRWEDDGTSDPFATSSVNKGSIAEYRERINQRPNFYYRQRWYPAESKD